MRKGWLAGACRPVVVGALFALLATPALASANGESPGHFRGVISEHNDAGRDYQAQLHAAYRRHGSNNLNYYGGPVMHTDTNYTIYWGATSSFSSSYESVVNGFFQNVAAADGTSNNVYSVARQYTDTTGSGFPYSASQGAHYGGAYSDTDAYPANGCSANAGSGICITDTQLQTEVKKFVTAHGLPSGLGTIYFVYTPSGVASCFSSSGSQCSTNVYCAYHSSFGSGSSSTLYANMPYAGVSGCESGEYPNSNVGADSVVNVTSHENIESITDPLGNAWFDSSGNEIGDKCAWNFGSALGGGAGSEYNQSISAGHYWLQQEWNNAISGCSQHA